MSEYDKNLIDTHTSNLHGYNLFVRTKGKPIIIDEDLVITREWKNLYHKSFDHGIPMRDDYLLVPGYYGYMSEDEAECFKLWFRLLMKKSERTVFAETLEFKIRKINIKSSVDVRYADEEEKKDTQDDN